MAKGDLNIPQLVRADMRARFASRIRKTNLEFDSSAEDEDVMTGHLGANLTTYARQVFVSDVELPGNWTWSLRYRKFRGRGLGATEKKLGADGIFELIVDGQSRAASFENRVGWMVKVVQPEMSVSIPLFD